MDKEDRAFPANERIAGSNYVVIQQEASGGHGSLYRVRHYTLKHRICALKILHEDLRSNTDVAARMEREAQIVSAMNHPNIVQVFDAGITLEVDDAGRPCGRPFIVMEWLKGRSLARVLADVQGLGLGLHDSLEIAIEVADALDYAHTQHGVIHRDIKPDNVFLQASTTLRGKTVTKLLDFGIASVLGGEKITLKPTFLGTARYASPEQLRGESPTPQTDLYAFGLLLYEMLVGYGPFDDATSWAKMTRAHLSGQPAPLPDRDFPVAIVQLVFQCLDKRSTARPPSAMEVATKLREIRNKAEARRAQNLADLSKTDPAPVLIASILASGEATDPGPAPGERPPTKARGNLDITAGDIPSARQAVHQTGARLGGDTSIDPSPFGAAISTTGRPNTRLEDPDAPSIKSLIDRLAVTGTLPPEVIRGPQNGTAVITPVMPPPPIIDGVAVRTVGDRYVFDRPDTIPPPRQMLVRPPPIAAQPVAPRPVAPAIATVTTTAAGVVSMDRPSLRTLLRSPVSIRYAIGVAATGIMGVASILIIGLAGIRSSHKLHSNTAAEPPVEVRPVQLASAQLSAAPPLPPPPATQAPLAASPPPSLLPTPTASPAPAPTPTVPPAATPRRQAPAAAPAASKATTAPRATATGRTPPKDDTSEFKTSFH